MEPPRPWEKMETGQRSEEAGGVIEEEEVEEGARSGAEGIAGMVTWKRGRRRGK